MIYALIAESMHHAIHLRDLLTLLAATRWEEIDPLYHARVMLHGDGPFTDSLEKRLRSQRAVPRQVQNVAALGTQLRQWSPQLLIFADWGSQLAATLQESQEQLLHCGTAVMALGPEGDEEAMIALDAGVNVYVGTPASEALVLAQATALLRHGHAWEQMAIDIPGILRVDPESRRVYIFDKELHLTKRLFHLFHYMAQQSERAFSPTEIAQHLTMSKRQVQQNTVAAQIHRLRKRMEEVDASSWLQTVHGFGYRLSIPRAK
ncbi:response regulator transcription factor [Acidithiobacillus sp. CV18-2]|uniref:Response regulator transcription factor n=1 Tax=Igneacidithiobacillus copahuensis TaxID=2724909 RepID=A0AAE2YRT3_9PROT|nr:winged helix-turn-helix domain-containing protein [Igneacidithiobacillus copahuensis]MBU2755777.1 response regulator transcription factor [Acidithiobacillus sp. CV18-3]MBU2757755.1 response regulator transcription factor [Acidithiobacillus sp. BN09-2]MBU2777410.1 response regulator transcription factor [Acidithiobacillus sp. CV18-2]MBU2796156.1 response regulator transcription factor [Acidithiobacillus sp. VAN18-2]MBU2798497.1 response regulator transcription factor [Acidithiobacillus sp. V